MRAWCFFVIMAVAGFAVAPANAQILAEPGFPQTCKVLTAGPPGQAAELQDALNKCDPGEAVELASGPGPGDDSFTIDPITIPASVSLIVDGGVTVYGTTEAKAYQTSPPSGTSPDDWICGKVDYYAKGDNLPCKSLITLSSKSGIYGYGIIDGQGGAHIQEEDGELGPTWWDLIDLRTDGKCANEPHKTGPKDASCLEGSPHMITAGTDAAPATNIVLYKITLRNPPMEAVTLKGGADKWSATLWGVKIQAPWNRGNTGALNLAGSNMLVKDNILSVGDQDIALEGSVGGPTSPVTSNIDIEGLRVYSRAGVALLDAGNGFSDITVNDFAMTGDVPSFIPGTDGAGASVNGVPASRIQNRYGLSVYSALPGGVSDTYGLQVFTGTLNKHPHTAENVTFSNACIVDVATPVNMQVAQPGQGVTGTNGGGNSGKIGPIYFNNIHVLTPSQQFVQEKGNDWVPRLYDFDMVGNIGNPSQITLNNFVYGDGEDAVKLLGKMMVAYNVFFTIKNVYPALFNSMLPSFDTSSWMFANNSYTARTPTNSPKLAHPCGRNLFPFTTGELYADLLGQNSGRNANRQIGTVIRSSSVTLNAIVQPTMSQAELLNKSNSTLAVPSPPLNGLVSFFDNGYFIGTSPLAGNGTIATLRIINIGAGIHIFTAEYADPPSDSFYNPLWFGHVIIIARS